MLIGDAATECSPGAAAVTVLPLGVVHLARVLGLRGAEEVVDRLLDHALGATGALVIVGAEVGLLPLTHGVTILTDTARNVLRRFRGFP